MEQGQASVYLDTHHRTGNNGMKHTMRVNMKEGEEEEKVKERKRERKKERKEEEGKVGEEERS